MDTIMIIRDSVACCMRKTAEICQPCVKEAGASCNDVTIVSIVCGTILLLAIIAAFTYLIQKGCERNAQKTAAEEKRKYEEKDRADKKQADLDAHELKRKEELENKLLNYIESKIDKGKTIAKEDNYIAELRNMINAKD